MPPVRKHSHGFLACDVVLGAPSGPSAGPPPRGGAGVTEASRVPHRITGTLGSPRAEGQPRLSFWDQLQLLPGGASTGRLDLLPRPPASCPHRQAGRTLQAVRSAGARVGAASLPSYTRRPHFQVRRA